MDIVDQIKPRSVVSYDHIVYWVMISQQAWFLSPRSHTLFPDRLLDWRSRALADGDPPITRHLQRLYVSLCRKALFLVHCPSARWLNSRVVVIPAHATFLGSFSDITRPITASRTAMESRLRPTWKAFLQSTGSSSTMGYGGLKYLAEALHASQHM